MNRILQYLNVRECPCQAAARKLDALIVECERVEAVEETNVFLVHVEVDESPDLAVFAAQMGAQRRKAAFDVRDQDARLGQP